MDRRSFLKTSAIGGSAAAASAALAAPAYAQGNRTLTMVTTWGRGLAGVHDSAQRVADSITAMTDGALTVDLKAAGELVGAFEVFDAVTAGQADMYHGADYYFVGQHPAYAFFTAVPFGMTAQELANWYYQDGGMELHDELGQIFGLKSFLGGNTGAQAGGWFSKEINSPDDFNGLKFRMPGLGGKA
ncbi:MAG: twin-arginine translocation signal domain-containing protein, partial [Pseudomonadota bacterium]|nr:twin-arginine translocation signal domain-containing protein [Pseudomonadota bacterium]